jgi:hypothetical protein
MYYIAKQKQYKDFATNWAKFTSTMDLSERQKRGMALFFKPIARRFGLTKDFKDIGIL